MVCIKQVSIPAVILLSLAEQAVAAPIAPRGDIAARDAALTADAIELAIRELELDERGLGKFVKGVAGKVIGAVKKNPGKTFDRTLSSANTAMTVANTHKTVSGKRDIEELDERDLEEEVLIALRDLDLDERGLGKFVKGVAGKVIGAVKKNPGKTFDRTLSSANTAMTVANTHKTVSGKRDLDELELAVRDLEDLDERDLDEIELALRDLEDRSLKSILTPAVKLTKAVKNVASKAVGAIKKNPGKTFDRTLSSANTAMTVANTHKTQQGKRDLEERDLDELEIALRDLEDLDERDIEELDLSLRDLEDRSLKSILTPAVKLTKAVKNVASKAIGAIKKNPGKTFDRTLSSANTAMTVANTHKTQQGKRDFEDIEERDWEDMEERDWEDMEERDVEELDERDWEDVEERDIDDLEARAIGQNLLKLAKGAGKAVGHVFSSVSKQQGQAYNRANAAANSAMKVAQTKKKQEKRDFEERDFEYLNSLSQRDLEDLELVVRALYGDYLEDY
ncbi:unnamed protein product [Clonostachys byssicola]|uniref:Uncharacterized protein n=1 Tax=Clonostachys byssicola TaxID=160290 RepID=A0A9N9UCJ5_9HYPO|nr:unnamed protein product [Clonostachys byssicola]